MVAYVGPVSMSIEIFDILQITFHMNKKKYFFQIFVKDLKS